MVHQGRRTADPDLGYCRAVEKGKELKLNMPSALGDRVMIAIFLGMMEALDIVGLSWLRYLFNGKESPSEPQIQEEQ